MSIYIYVATVSKDKGLHRVEVPALDMVYDAHGEPRDVIVAATERAKGIILEHLIEGEQPPADLNDWDELDVEENVEAGCRLFVLTIEVDPPDDEFFTVEQVMGVLGVTQPRISHLLASGKLKAIKKGRRNLITRSSLEAYLATPRTPGRPRKDRTSE